MTRRSPPRVAGHAQAPASRAHPKRRGRTPRATQRAARAHARGALETCVSLPRRRRCKRQIQSALQNRKVLGSLLRAFRAVL